MMCGRSGIALLFLCALLCSSCSTKRSDVLLSRERPDATDLIARVRAMNNQVQTMTGTGSVSFETPTLGGSVYFHVSLRKPDSLLVRFEGPFGIDAGFLFLTPGQYIMYNSLENQVTQGSPTSANIRSIIPLDLTYEQIVNAFAGAFPPPPDTTAPYLYAIDGSAYLLTYPEGSDTVLYWIDPSSYLVTKYQRRDRAGVVIANAEAGRFLREDEMSAPRLITVAFPRERQQVSIYYSSLLLNPPEVSFAYSIPTGVRTRTGP